MKTSRIFIILFLCFINIQDGICQLGELAPGPTIRKSIQGVQVELSLGFWVNPDLLIEKVPPTTKLMRVKSYGIPD